MSMAGSSANGSSTGSNRSNRSNARRGQSGGTHERVEARSSSGSSSTACTAASTHTTVESSAIMESSEPVHRAVEYTVQWKQQQQQQQQQELASSPTAALGTKPTATATATAATPAAPPSPDYPPHHPYSPTHPPRRTVSLPTENATTEPPSRATTAADDEDEQSSREGSSYFLSEPSVSEDGDSSHRVRAPHVMSGMSSLVQSPLVRDNTRANSRRLERDAVSSHASSSLGYQTPDEATTLPAAVPVKSSAWPVPSAPLAPVPPLGSSPGGNTSLSSWESPAWHAKRHVWLQFVMPEPKVRSSTHAASMPAIPIPHPEATPSHPTHSPPVLVPFLNPSYQSTPQSTPQPTPPDEYPETMSHRSGRRQRQSPHKGANGLFRRGRSLWNRSSASVSSFFPDGTGDPRDTREPHDHSETASYDPSPTTYAPRPSIQNHNRWSPTLSTPHCDPSQSQPTLRPQQRTSQDSLLLSPTTSINPHSVDDSLAMTLSDSEYAGGYDDKSLQSSDRPLDWERRRLATPPPTHDTEAATYPESPHAAMTASPRQLQRHSLSSHPQVNRTKHNGHRRNRSGDEAAAKIVTGGVGWKGMEPNGIVQYPLERESVESRMRSSRRLHRPVRPSTSPPSSPGSSPHGSDSRQAWIRQMALLHAQTAALDSAQHAGPASLPSTPRGSVHSREEVSSGDESSDTEGSESHGDSTSQASNRMPLHNYAQGLEALRHTTTPYRSNAGQSESPFANLGKKSAERASRSSFLPTMTYETDDPKYPTFICPRCKTRQREFFTVANAAGRLEGPGSYLALYFAIYVICSLFIFGLEEGWMPLDCTYFAVITLTTAGLGDFVPTSDVNKIICSIFIYFGVACIGLLLGSYIAGMLDDRATRDRKEKQIESCPNCARISISREYNARSSRNEPRSTLNSVHYNRKHLSERFSSEVSPTKPQAAVFSPRHSQHPPAPPPFANTDPQYRGLRTSQSYDSMDGATNDYAIGHDLLSSPTVPSPLQFLGRQSHTRHASFDISQQQSLLINSSSKSYGTTPSGRASFSGVSTHSVTVTADLNSSMPKMTSKLRTIASSDNLMDGFSESDDESSVTSSSTESSTEEVWDSTKSRIQAGKYVFLTLRLALLNSLVIIAVGCVGFWVIEGFSLVDSWYFATVLLTTVGYGDIVPVTDGGKLFATVYILVAGTILLNNMSAISMIPLELRRRRIERTILTQFGDHLDDAALRELATGPVVQRLRLAANRTDGLDECTREMFSLAMLVRLGKVTEHDIRETFASFRHLDVNNEGVLNSKSIIAGMIAKQRINRMAASASCSNLSQLAPSSAGVSPLDTPLRPSLQSQYPMTMEQHQEQQRLWYSGQGTVPDTQNRHYNKPYYGDSYPYFGERTSLLGVESAGLPDDENVSWLP